MEIKLWKDKSKKQIDSELFSNMAEKFACEINTGRKESKDKKNKHSQIRKFYDEVLIFDDQIKANPDNFDKILPYVKMINAKASYAEGRGFITPEFKKFIKDSVSQINDKEDFEIFKNFFEAFMGFYKYYEKKGI